jgi:hypothetical protein
VWPFIGAIAVVGVLFIGVFPTRTWLGQRAEMNSATEQLRVSSAENERLEERVEALGSDAEIERLARQKYNLVRPGEEAYAILPAPPPPVEIPRVWPFAGLADRLSPASPEAPTEP